MAPRCARFQPAALLFWLIADPTRVEMTASDEQTLEEEYENQESWHTDEKSPPPAVSASIY